MARSPALLRWFRGLAFSALVGIAGAILPAATPARAQAIAVVVNGQAISEADVASRQRLLALSNRGRLPPRPGVVEELIDERLRLQEAQRLRIRIDEDEVSRAFASIAQRVNLTPERMVAEFGRLGINPRTLRDRLRADLAWSQVVQARFQRLAPIRDADVIEALRQRGRDPDSIRAFEYVVAQAVVFVPRNASPAVVRERQQAAERLRGSINGCDDVVERVRAVRDAAVRDTVRRNGNEMPPQLREILDRTPNGRATPINRGQNGFELLIVCDRKEISGREGAAEEMRRQMTEAEMGQSAQRLLQDLRARAQIERRR